MLELSRARTDDKPRGEWSSLRLSRGAKEEDKCQGGKPKVNRQITGRIATYNFSPTPLSESNLKEEKAHGQIFVTGNTVIDALHMVVEKLKTDNACSRIVRALKGEAVERYEV